MQTHLYFWCAGIFFLATYSLENCKQFWSQSRSSVDGSDGSRCSFHNSPWWFLRDFSPPPSRDPPFRGSNWPPISEEVPIKGQSSTSFRPEKDVKDGFLGNQPFIMWEMVGWVTLFWPCFDVAEVCGEATQKPTGFPGTTQKLCGFGDCLRDLVKLSAGFCGACLGTERNIKQTSSNYRLYFGLSPCPVIVTTRSCTFLVGNSFASFATVAGKGLRSQLYMLGWFLKRLQERVAAIVAIAFFIPILVKTHRQIISRTADIFEVKLSFITSKL